MIWVDTRYPGYRVSNAGDVEGPGGRHQSRKRLKPCPVGRGYLMVIIMFNGKRIGVRVHRLVLESFSIPSTQGLHVNHKDFNKRNNRLDNLEWMTPGENCRHAIAAGRSCWITRKGKCPK